MTDDRLQHRWDKGSAGAKCIDCGVGAITPQSLQPCPGKSVEVQPRVWVGVDRPTYHSGYWQWCVMGWVRVSGGMPLHHGCIFAPSTGPVPTIDPAEMETIRTAKVVDWDD